MNPLTADDPRMIGEFRLRARLGAGGMGRVYLGFSPAGRAVAVKVIHPHLARDPAFADRFRREVAAAQAVSAVYATPVVAAGPDDDPPWLATAFVPGPPLQDVVMTAGPLPEAAVLRLAAGLAEALRAIHASGLVHRDLKPANVLLALDGPRVIDFGIARALDGTVLTSAESILGTPSYMSPEQAQGRQAGPPSDVFSLGGVAYFAATGMAPFGAGIPATVLYRIVYTEPVLDSLPPALRGLITACLAKNPAGRPSPARLAAGLKPPPAPGDSPAAFWPAPVARLIRDYQAELRGDDRAPVTAPNRRPHLTRQARREARDGRHAAATGMDRRRVLAAMAGLTTVGLAAGGWDLARSPTSHVPGNLSTRHRPARPAPRPGTKIWSVPTNSSVSGLALGGTVVYAGTSQDTVYALDAGTGKELWRRATLGTQNYELALARDAVIIGSNNSMLALKPGTGERLWDAHPSSNGPLGVAAAGDVVYAGFEPRSATTGGITALNATTGDLLWTYPLGPLADETTGIAVSGDVVYAATTNGEVLALDAAIGKPLWRVTAAGGTVLLPPIVTDGVVYTSGTTIYAVNATNGTMLWHRAIGAAAFMAVAEGVLFTTVPGGLAALNAASGKTLWHVPVAGGVNLWPAVAGNVVYSGSNHGVLDAWQATTGNRLWSHPTSTARVESNIVVTEEMLYFGSGDHDVYALAI